VRYRSQHSPPSLLFNASLGPLQPDDPLTGLLQTKSASWFDIRPCRLISPLPPRPRFLPPSVPYHTSAASVNTEAPGLAPHSSLPVFERLNCLESSPDRADRNPDVIAAFASCDRPRRLSTYPLPARASFASRSFTYICKCSEGVTRITRCATGLSPFAFLAYTAADSSL
jgi:hypothetical protein